MRIPLRIRFLYVVNGAVHSVQNQFALGNPIRLAVPAP